MDDLPFDLENDIDNALDQLPFGPVPACFVDQVMMQVQQQSVSNGRSTPGRFRLQFLDVTLSLLWLLTLIASWFCVLWWTGMINLAWLPQVQISLSLIDRFSPANPALLFGGAVLLLVEISLLVLVGLNLLDERPFAG